MKRLLFAMLVVCSLAVPAWAVVDVNTASQSELESVKGLGPAKAKAIIEYRDKHGAFKNVDDLAKVKGLGKASVDKLKGELAIGQAKAGAAADKPKK